MFMTDEDERFRHIRAPRIESDGDRMGIEWTMMVFAFVPTSLLPGASTPPPALPLRVVDQPAGQYSRTRAVRGGRGRGGRLELPGLAAVGAGRARVVTPGHTRGG